MTKQAHGHFSIKGWDQKPFSEAEGTPKLTHASVTQGYEGDVTGEGTLAYLMMYAADGSAYFIGLERVQGTLHGQAGSFVLQHGGKFEGGAATSTYSVLEGSGTEALAGLRGHGSYRAVHGEGRVAYTLEYELA